MTQFFGAKQFWLFIYFSFFNVGESGQHSKFWLLPLGRGSKGCSNAKQLSYPLASAHGTAVFLAHLHAYSEPRHTSRFLLGRRCHTTSSLLVLTVRLYFLLHFIHQVVPICFNFSRNLFNSLVYCNITLHPFLFAITGWFLFVLLCRYFSGSDKRQAKVSIILNQKSWFFFFFLQKISTISSRIPGSFFNFETGPS